MTIAPEAPSTPTTGEAHRGSVDDVGERIADRNFKLKERRLQGKVNALRKTREKKAEEFDAKIKDSWDDQEVSRLRSRRHNMWMSYQDKIRRAQDKLHEHRMSKY